MVARAPELNDRDKWLTLVVHWQTNKLVSKHFTREHDMYGFRPRCFAVAPDGTFALLGWREDSGWAFKVWQQESDESELDAPFAGREPLLFFVGSELAVLDLDSFALNEVEVDLLHLETRTTRKVKLDLEARDDELEADDLKFVHIRKLFINLNFTR
jgi:hypothetical protein